MGPIRLSEITFPKDIIDKDLDCKDLALKMTLTDKTFLTILVALGYKASWGDKVYHQGVMSLDINASTFKLHLAYIHPLNTFFPNEDKMELATRMTLLINGIEMVDEYIVGADMACKTTGQGLYLLS